MTSKNEKGEKLCAEVSCKILHISKCKCTWMFQNGMIPCKDTGKKTHRYVVMRSDLDKYIKDSAEHPEKYFIPVTFTAKKPGKRELDKYYLYPHQVPSDFRAWLDDEWYDLPDVITPKDAETVLGYEYESVSRWNNRGWLRITKAHYAELIPREWLIDFTCDYAFQIIKKSEKHVNCRINTLANIYKTFESTTPEGFFFSVYNLNHSRLFTKMSTQNIVIAIFGY